MAGTSRALLRGRREPLGPGYPDSWRPRQILSTTIETGPLVEQQLRDLALRQGKATGAVLEEGVRTFVEAAAVTDLEPEQVADAHIARIGELGDLAEGKEGRG